MWNEEDGGIIETELETGHVIVHCKQHQREWCHQCCVDFRDMNEDARRSSQAELSAKASKDERKKPCSNEGCSNGGNLVCASCKLVSYCSKECQRADWKKRHKKACQSKLPTFVTSISKQVVTTYPIGTRIEMVGGTAPLVAKILKFNSPGTGTPSDPTAEHLATYSLKAKDGDGEIWDEPCEDVHCEGSWRKIM